MDLFGPAPNLNCSNEAVCYNAAASSFQYATFSYGLWLYSIQSIISAQFSQFILLVSKLHVYGVKLLEAVCSDN